MYQPELIRFVELVSIKSGDVLDYRLPVYLSLDVHSSMIVGRLYTDDDAYIMRIPSEIVCISGFVKGMDVVLPPAFWLWNARIQVFGLDTYIREYYPHFMKLTGVNVSFSSEINYGDSIYYLYRAALDSEGHWVSVQYVDDKSFNIIPGISHEGITNVMANVFANRSGNTHHSAFSNPMYKAIEIQYPEEINGFKWYLPNL